MHGAAADRLENLARQLGFVVFLGAGGGNKHSFLGKPLIFTRLGRTYKSEIRGGGETRKYLTSSKKVFPYSAVTQRGSNETSDGVWA